MILLKQYASRHAGLEVRSVRDLIRQPETARIT